VTVTTNNDNKLACMNRKKLILHAVSNAQLLVNIHFPPVACNS